MTELVIKAVLGYLIGSVVGSLVVGRLRGGVDIRNMGSGNAGATNALRTQSKSFAFLVLLIDIGKGWLAANVVSQVLIPGVPLSPDEIRVWIAPACAVAAIVGHIYPIWHGFRGGKGVATLIGVVLGLNPVLLVPMLITWFLVVMVFGYVSLASMLAAAALPIYVSAVGIEPGLPLTTFGVAMTALIVFTHRGNIARIRRGTEPRARRLWLFGRHDR